MNRELGYQGYFYTQSTWLNGQKLVWMKIEGDPLRGQAPSLPPG
jgi:hypothetical protein